MKYFYLILILIIFSKINISSETILYVDPGEECFNYTLTNITNSEVYIVSNISSLSSGGIVVTFETNNTNTTTDDDSFNYLISQVKDEIVNQSNFINIRALKTTIHQNKNTFSTLYFIDDTDKYGILKVKKVEEGQNISIKVMYTKASSFIIYIVIFIAIVLVVGIIVGCLVKKISTCQA